MSDDFNPYEVVKDCKDSIRDRLIYKLEAIIESNEEEEVYFWDICHEEIDSSTPVYTDDAYEFIKCFPCSEYVDEGLIDNSSLDRSIVTRAYASLEEQLVDDDDFQEWQEWFNNETINVERAKELLRELKEVD